MEKVTEERLVKAGWDEKRTIDISNIKDVYQKLGLVMPMNVEKFLTVYGMLVFERKPPSDSVSMEHSWGKSPQKLLRCITVEACQVGDYGSYYRLTHTAPASAHTPV